MNIDLEKKQISCYCGKKENMDGAMIQNCPDCKKAYFLPQCDCKITHVEIPILLYNYIETYQIECALNHEPLTLH